MTQLQTSYTAGLAVGLPGMIANAELANKVSRTVENSAGIAFGQPAFRGAADHGCIAGASFAATSVGSADGTNIGTGTISAAPAVAAPAKAGRYIAELRATGATASFDLIDPDGLIVGDGNVGSAATLGGVGPFTISNAGTMTVGDRFYIDVTYTADSKFLGLSVLTTAVAVKTDGSAADAYRQYDTAAVMTIGPMWVVAGGTVSAGQAVYWDPATGRYSNDTTKIRVPNARFDTSGVNSDLVIVDIRLRDA